MVRRVAELRERRPTELHRSQGTGARAEARSTATFSPRCDQTEVRPRASPQGASEARAIMKIRRRASLSSGSASRAAAIDTRGSAAPPPPPADPTGGSVTCSRDRPAQTANTSISRGGHVVGFALGGELRARGLSSPAAQLGHVSQPPAAPPRVAAPLGPGPAVRSRISDPDPEASGPFGVAGRRSEDALTQRLAHRSGCRGRPSRRGEGVPCLLHLQRHVERGGAARVL